MIRGDRLWRYVKKTKNKKKEKKTEEGFFSHFPSLRTPMSTPYGAAPADRRASQAKVKTISEIVCPHSQTLAQQLHANPERLHSLTTIIIGCRLPCSSKGTTSTSMLIS